MKCFKGTAPFSQENYQYDSASHRLLGITDDTGTTTTAFVYDANGNTTSKGSASISYTAENRIKTYQGTGAAVYTYNVSAQRMTKVSGGVTTRYVYDQQGQLVGEYAGGITKEIVYLDNEPLAQFTGNSLSYLHNDHLATPQVMTDSAQTVVWAGDMEPFGKTTSVVNTVSQDLRFPGQVFDGESGFHYNWNRYYDPSTGRYITSDPIGLSGGSNTYTYVENMPLRFKDILGPHPSPGEEVGIRRTGGTHTNCMGGHRNYIDMHGVQRTERCTNSQDRFEYVWTEDKKIGCNQYLSCTASCVADKFLGTTDTHRVEEAVKEKAKKAAKKALKIGGVIGNAIQINDIIGCTIECSYR